jgi:hypothetical protein
MSDVSTKSVSRRKFLRGGAVAAGAAAGGLAMPAVVTAQSPQVIRMQSSWTSSDIFQEMAQQYADRVNAMSAGRLQVDLTPAGAIVQAFQVQDAVPTASSTPPIRCRPTGTASTRPHPCSAPARSTAGKARRCSPGSSTAAARSCTRNSSRTSSA